MLLRVECGKGGRHRNAMLAQDLLVLLREWWKIGRKQGVMHPDGWLFPGQHYLKPVSTRQVHRIAAEAAHAAGLTWLCGCSRDSAGPVGSGGFAIMRRMLYHFF